MSVGRALVTGGSRGIGRAVAIALAEHGWSVTLLARDSAALEETLRALPGQGHGALAFDVADEEAWQRAAPQLSDLAGLVCAAGVLEPIGPIGTYGASEFRRALEVNLLGTMLAIKTCLPALRRSRGAVVTLSGGGATGPLPRFDAYAASKAAVVRLTENLAVELRDDGVRVNSIAPGFVATEIHDATLAAGPELVGADYFERTRDELASGGVPATEAAELACLMLDRDQPVAFSGRLVSAQWDPWREEEFRRQLAEKPALGTLRRIDDVLFAPVGSGG